MLPALVTLLLPPLAATAQPLCSLQMLLTQQCIYLGLQVDMLWQRAAPNAKQ
jgi:hypothetical protein